MNPIKAQITHLCDRLFGDAQSPS